MLSSNITFSTAFSSPTDSLKICSTIIVYLV
jgi:hypothetical protein